MLDRKAASKVIKALMNIYPSHFGSGQKILSNQRKSSDSYASYFEDINLLKLMNIVPKIDSLIYIFKVHQKNTKIYY